jgi:hypothetical protein
VSATGQIAVQLRAQRLLCFALVLTLYGLLMPATVRPAAAADPVGPTLTVDTVADDPAAAGCIEGVPADCSLRGALINANADGNAEIETVVVPAGVYVLTVPGDGTATGSLDVRSSLVLQGAGAESTIIDANGLDRVLTVNGGGATADRAFTASGLTFRGGRPCNQLGGGDDGGNTAGGGLMILGIGRLSDVIVESNVSCAAGGGIWSPAFGASLTLERVVIRGNTGRGGGGIRSDGSLTMLDSTVSGNTSDLAPGGGLHLRGTAVIDGSTITGNHARARGGGIDSGDDASAFCCYVTATITNSTISGNVSHAFTSGTPQRFPGISGGIHIERSAFTLRHVTITENVAETHPETGGRGSGGGISSTVSRAGFLTIENSIVAGNVGIQECNLLSGLTFSATGLLGCGGPLDPVLGPLAANGGPTLTHLPESGSPALDAGESTVCASDDQRNEPRPSGPGCDLGAVEVQIAPPPPPPTGPVDTILAVTGEWSLPLGQLEDPVDRFRFDVRRSTTSLAAFDGSDLFGPNGPTAYVLGVDAQGSFGDTLTLAADVPAGWLAVFGGDCAADGSIELFPGQVRTCHVTNVALDGSQPDPSAGIVFETAFRTPPAVSLGAFDVVLTADGSEVFAFDATELDQAGRHTLGFAVPAGQSLGVGVTVHGPAGWLGIVGGDCADGSRVFLEAGALRTCTIEWFEVGDGVVPPVDLLIEDCTAAALTGIGSVAGDVILADPDCASLSLPALTSIGGSLRIVDSATLADLSLPSLATVAGDVIINGNATLHSVGLGSLGSIGGSLIVTDNATVDQVATSATTVDGSIQITANPSLSMVDAPALESVGGDVSITDGASLTMVDVPTLSNVEGSIQITANPSLSMVDAPALESVGGDVSITDGASLTLLGTPTLTNVDGSIQITANPSLSMVDAPALESVGGDVSITDGASLTMVDVPTLSNVEGSIQITANPSLSMVDAPLLESVGGSIDVSVNATLAGGTGLALLLPALVSVGGSVVIDGNVQLLVIEAPIVADIGDDLVVTDNAALGEVLLPELDTVGGDVVIEATASVIDLATASVAGDMTIVGTGTAILRAETAMGTTALVLRDDAAAIDATLVAGTFDTNVPFTIERLDGAELDPIGDLDPLAAYHLDFSVPTLGLDAAISLSLSLDELSAKDRADLLDAIAAGRATLAVRADGGAAYETLAVCGAGQTPEVDGCVLVELDGGRITFRGVAAHFSSWAVVVVAAPDTTPPVITVPGDRTVEAAGPGGLAVHFGGDVAALDDRDGAVAVVCDPSSGSTFPLGTTVVTCTAVDAAGNRSSATFAITVADTAAPVVTVPGTITIPAANAAGAVVAFDASATDAVSGPAATTCTPSSGSTFAIGDTTVTCRASDAAGNVGTTTFVVRVLGPSGLLAMLRDEVATATPPLKAKLAADLAGKLHDAIVKLDQRKTADACKKVQEFIVKVEQEASRRSIPVTLATDWLDRARHVRTLLGC